MIAEEELKQSSSQPSNLGSLLAQRYLKQEKLSEGSYGAVYKALDR